MNAIMSYLKPYFKQSIGQFRDKDALSIILSLITKLGICISLMTFGLVVGYILIKGFPHLDSRLFEWHYSTQNASMLPAIINTFTMIIFALILATPIGILGAIFLVQYAKSDSVIVAIISIAAETLVGIPSIIYGLFGYLAFVIYFGFGLSIISGALTLAIMILPLILRNTQESLKSVPQTYKEASFALGAGKLRTIFRVILPCAISGILAGVILAIGRIVGESAALLYTSGTVAKIASLNDSGRTLSVHMYALLSEGQYLTQAYATAVVLLIFVVIINFTSNFLVKKLSPLHIS
ncbi:phosphate ABC transporter permease PstA [Helicobacter fennelliae]|uniref:Phosphate transport system permease protein PstA n=1 Tax=Helicobacter fennelliae MRY12-0050 TaxID=1325130 RepID=T1CQS4_9HELI|nr:phosphate ABC transporter permease PstA [Helicobacter fennelliae]GAD19094.1 phosphate transport system permease protein PstA [Helicobacter fennelliae MRY12-0050]STP14412.1 phosphate ABC transporter [Helicobacter fennelliae]STQ84454.1 phosphate ABC transporter [Helicobacter fennelliae]